jgi:hypothetical protein
MKKKKNTRCTKGKLILGLKTGESYRKEHCLYLMAVWFLSRLLEGSYFGNVKFGFEKGKS